MGVGGSSISPGAVMVPSTTCSVQAPDAQEGSPLGGSMLKANQGQQRSPAEGTHEAVARICWRGAIAWRQPDNDTSSMKPAGPTPA